jgi:hypothetical protein
VTVEEAMAEITTGTMTTGIVDKRKSVNLFL